eukprot:TRINITY_DN3439_c0_g3_i1.p1 TRINITY_DN3439_c0_g3~~TRINITY_DN3439_c0_g3_i1.p1  ORF type:complete len:765 (+),score=70.99 TRINITY_DN3439_c0_g3_i1:91-2385(+)
MQAVPGCTKFLSVTHAANDSALTVLRKNVLFMYVVGGVVICAFPAVSMFINGSLMSAACMLFTVVAGTIAVVLFVKKRVTMTLIGTAVLTGAVCIWMIDYWAAALGTNRLWSAFVVLLDILLVMEMPRRLTHVLMVAVTVWMFVAAAEDAFRMGLYDVEGIGLPTYEQRRSGFDCEKPPCEAGGQGLFQAIPFCFVFWMDFYFTRGFADSVNAEKVKMQNSIAAAESIAASLAAFDLDAAEATLAHIPLPLLLHTAFNEILENLRSYKPYLPLALFEHTEEHTPHPLKRSAPTGDNVALVFTDIQGSTATWEACPDAMRKALTMHNTILRECLRAHNGYEVKTIGDSFMIALDHVSEACWFGIDAQLRLFEQDWPSELESSPHCPKVPGLWNGINIRIGVHFGAVDVEANPVTGRYDYFGATVNKAARVEGACAGGGVAITSEVLDAIKADPAGPLSAATCYAMGNVVLKGIKDPVDLTQLFPVGLAGRESGMPMTADTQLPFTRLMSNTSINTVTSGAVSHASFNYKPREVSSATVGQVIVLSGPMKEAENAMVPESVDVVCDAMASIALCLDMTSGSIMTVLSTAVIVGWNTAKSCVSHLESSFKFFKTVQGSLGASHDVRMGIACGSLISVKVGSTGQRFVTMMGSCVPLAASLATAAIHFHAHCLHGTVPGHPCSATNDPRLRKLIRPIDNWVLNNTSFTVYEVTHDQPDSWAWSPTYAKAFASRNYREILERAPEDATLKAASRIIEDEVPAVRVCAYV